MDWSCHWSYYWNQDQLRLCYHELQLLHSLVMNLLIHRIVIRFVTESVMLTCLCFQEEFEENMSFHFRHRVCLQVALKQVQCLVELRVSRVMVDDLEVVLFWKLC